MLIVIDGSDASGKNTQCKLLVERLRKEQKKVALLEFPRYDSFFGKMIRDYLNGEYGQINQIDPKLVSLIYALDRFTAKERIQKWLDEGTIVILDRYVESNMAYQAAKAEDKKKFVEWVEKLEYGEFGLPKPDIVIYLHVPIDFSQKLISTRKDKEYLNGKKSDMHESNTEYLKKVENMYQQLSKDRKWIVIECVENAQLLAKEKISEKIWNSIGRASI